MQFLVKGAYHRGKDVRDLSDSLEVDTEVTIKRESDNQYDEFACQVFYEEIHIGYVEKDMAPSVAYLFDELDKTDVKGKIIGREHGAKVSYPMVEVDDA